jgi:hypothetical protein
MQMQIRCETVGNEEVEKAKDALIDIENKINKRLAVT